MSTPTERDLSPAATATATTTPAETKAATRDVDYEDVDDVIGIAAELARLDADRLSVEELVSIAGELDIPEKYLKPAIEELRQRRTALLAAEQRHRQRRRWVVVGVGVAALVLVIWAFAGQAALSNALAGVTQAQAQVENVLERQRATRDLWEAQPPSSERTAELAGAENRVRLERRRYDEAAAAYNADVGAFPASLWASLFGFPDSVPLSNALRSW